MKNKKALLLSLGMLVISVSLVVKHYLQLPDLLSGFMTGTGIGLALLAFMVPRSEKAA